MLLINEKLITKINRSLNSYSVNETNTNTEYNTTQVLCSNLYFATANNDATCENLTPLKYSEIPSTKSIPDFTIGFIASMKKTIGNKFLRKIQRHNI